MKSTTKGCIIRECFFEPTFHKFQWKLCSGLHFHTDFSGYNPNQTQIFRVMALVLKCIHELYPEFQIYRDFSYEYVDGKLPFDVINGGPKLREWIDNSAVNFDSLDKALSLDEKAWEKASKKYYLY